MSILFKELAGSPVEIYAPDGMKAERRLLCAYEDRHAVAATLLGGSQLIGGPTQAIYPDHPGVVAMRVRIEPFEKRPDNQGTFDDLTADLNSYSGQFAEVIVNYELHGADDGSHPRLPKTEHRALLSYRMDFGGEYLTVPGHALRWNSDATIPVLPDAAPALRIPITEHHVTWHRVVAPPWEAIRACVGAVNVQEFMGAAAETVLFDGAKADRQFTGLDDLRQPQFGWQITYIFREKTIKALDDHQEETVYGWNHSYRPEQAGASHWDKLIDENNNTIYRAVDFSPLFQFDVQ